MDTIDIKQEDIFYQIELPFGQNQVVFITDAIIEEIRQDRRNDMVTVSYENRSGNFRRQETLVLIVSNNTRILNQFGQNVSRNELRIGARINALVSAAMTASLPPQTNAFIIVINERRRPNLIAEGRIVNVNEEDNVLVIREREDGRDRERDRERDRDRDGRIRFFINNRTRIVNRRGRRIQFEDLRRDDQVQVEYQVIREAGRREMNIAINIQII